MYSLRYLTIILTCSYQRQEAVKHVHEPTLMWQNSLNMAMIRSQHLETAKFHLGCSPSTVCSRPCQNESDYSGGLPRRHESCSCIRMGESSGRILDTFSTQTGRASSGPLCTLTKLALVAHLTSYTP